MFDVFVMLRQTPRGAPTANHIYLNDVELVDLAVPGEQRLPVHQLAHDAPNCPQVYGRVVPSRSQQQLGGAVPPKT